MTGPAGVPIATISGRPAGELTDEELEAQGTQAHATRNWVFLHGTAEQFARHTSRMLELEQEYLRRHPQRTWQGSGGAPTGSGDEAAALREALRGIVRQLDALAADPVPAPHAATTAADPVLLVLSAVAAAPGGRLHKLEVHQAAREAGLDRASLATLYTADEPLLATEQHDRVITEAGRERLRRAGRSSGRGPDRSTSPAWSWQHQDRPVWDADKQRVIGGAGAGIFDLPYRPGDALPGDWWAALDESGRAVGFGWMDVTWGEAEILLAVEPDAQQSGLGTFVLEHLEAEAAARGLNYVFNTVRDTHPRREEIQDWLGVRGYTGSSENAQLRKRVGVPTDTTTPAPPAAVPGGGTDLGPGREDSGGYVDVDEHRY